MERYRVKHYKSSPYYPKSNGQAEATNKTLIKILSKTLDDHPKKWAEQLPIALWAYRTSKRKPTGETPYALVYGEEAILPAEIEIPSARMRLRSLVEEESRPAALEALADFRDKAKEKLERYHKRLRRQYNTAVVPRQILVGDLVLKTATQVMRGTPTTKFYPKWEGPYRVREISESGYCKISRVGSDAVSGPLNLKWVKKYYT